MKRVLIITYYWPPAGGAGVQRWLKHSKYLRSYGWEPVIYTPENPDQSITDKSLLQDVPEGLECIRTTLWEPYELFRKFSGKRSDEAVNHGMMSEDTTPGVLHRIGMWIRGNFFIPDARKFWIKPSIKFLTDYVNQHPVDAIITTGPPQSMHLIGLEVHRNTGIPWIADFRDPWTNNDVYNRLPLTMWADKKHRDLEKKVLQLATEVVTVSQHWAKEMEGISGREVQVITNGFDSSDFTEQQVDLMPGFVIHHIGSMYADRNPETLWRVLSELLAEHVEWQQELKVRLTGKTDQVVIQSVRNFGLDKYLEVQDYIPHNEVLQQMQASTVLLLMLNDAPDVMGRIPGKIFEYLASRRPVLGLGAVDGDSAHILESAQAGEVVAFDDRKGLRKVLETLFAQYTQGQLAVPQTEIEKYSRKKLAGDYADLLNTMILREQEK